MDSKNLNDCSYAEKRKAAMQLKQHNTYSQVSAHKKEVLLLARCLKTDFTGHNLLENPTIDTPMQQTSCWYRDGFPKQAASLHLSSENLQRFLKKLPVTKFNQLNPKTF